MFSSGDDKSPRSNTQSLHEVSPRFQRLLHNTNVKGSTAPLTVNRDIALLIRGMVERCQFRETSSLILGREDEANRVQVDVDLTAYGAMERGVSRVHAQLYCAPSNRLYVMDMGSSNGTFLAGEKLKPFRPQLIRNGDFVLLGSLSIQIIY
jgi:pSer/pThr/pTyr-binding forkhead associated (FHA) protein